MKNNILHTQDMSYNNKATILRGYFDFIPKSLSSECVSSYILLNCLLAMVFTIRAEAASSEVSFKNLSFSIFNELL